MLIGLLHLLQKTELIVLILQFEPRSEKTGLRGFRPGPAQTGLYEGRLESMLHGRFSQ